MLSVRPKITELNFSLFARYVHPEYFDHCVTRCFPRELYELKVHITRDGHYLEFQHRYSRLVEVAASAFRPMPEAQQLINHPIKNAMHDQAVLNDVNYQSQVELEQVDPKLFVTIQQQLNNKHELEGLIHRFESNGRIAFGAISYIHVQSFQRHALIRAFHTFPDTCAVLKSESRFSIL